MPFDLTDVELRVRAHDGQRSALADHTRITIAAQAVGIAQGALDYALGYAQERRQFGKPNPSTTS